MKKDYNIYNKKNVKILLVDGNEISGIVFLHQMEYPKRLIFEVNAKFYEEFQVRNIEEIDNI